MLPKCVSLLFSSNFSVEYSLLYLFMQITIVGSDNTGTPVSLITLLLPVKSSLIDMKIIFLIDFGMK